jgi:hypothetical protein
MEIVVVFPAPFGPNNPKVSLFPIAKQVSTTIFFFLQNQYIFEGFTSQLVLVSLFQILDQNRVLV